MWLSHVPPGIHEGGKPVETDQRLEFLHGFTVHWIFQECNYHKNQAKTVLRLVGKIPRIVLCPRKIVYLQQRYPRNVNHQNNTFVSISICSCHIHVNWIQMQVSDLLVGILVSLCQSLYILKYTLFCIKIIFLLFLLYVIVRSMNVYTWQLYVANLSINLTSE